MRSWKPLLALIFGGMSLGISLTAIFTLIARVHSAGVSLLITVCVILPLAWFMAKYISGEHGEDIVEYAVLLACIIILVIGAVRLISYSAANHYSQINSTMESDGSDR